MTNTTPPPRFETYRPAQERTPPGGDPDPRRPGAATPQPQFRSPPKPPSRLLSGLLYGGVALVALAGGAAAFLFMALPSDLIQSRIAAEIKARTGRDLIIAGPASFTLFPSPGVTLADVSLSAPPGANFKPLVSMSGLDVSVALLPLLKRQVVVRRLVMRQPRINLEIDAEGRKSWDFAAADQGQKTPGKIRLAGAAPETLSDASETTAPREPEHIEDLVLTDVRIEGGTLRYADTRSGTEERFEAINAALALTSIASPLEARGRFVWKAKRVDFEGELTSLDTMLANAPARLVLGLTSDAMSATFDGAAFLTTTFAAEGTLKGEAPSARALAAWLGSELPPSAGFGPLSVAAQVRADNKTLVLSSAEIGLDGATLQGDLAIEKGPARPRLKADLKLSELDLNKYMGSGAPPPAETAPAAPSAPGAAPDSIDDLLHRNPPGPKVKGFTGRAGWSHDPIDVSLLNLVDADAKLSLERLVVRDMRTGPATISVALDNGLMKATLTEVALYDGHGKGLATVDATSPAAPAVAVDMTLDAISALPFLKDATAIEWLDGKGRIALALSGKGQTQTEIIESLNGKIDLALTDGAIVGINIPRMARAVSEGRMADLSSTSTEKTDFSELTATWTVSDGVAQNQDLKLTSPLLRVTGEGRVSLPSREIDYQLKPRLVADLAGQGGDQGSKGIEVPVRVTGPWEKPKFKADLATVLKDPNKAIETIKEIGKQFKGKKASDIVKGLFGGKKPDAETAPPPAQ